MGEEAKDHCGICVAHTLHDTYSFIKAQQNRGREAAGIACIGDTIDIIKWEGRVSKFGIEDLHKIFPGDKYHTYLGHVRYATRGRKDKILEDAHPHSIGGVLDHRGNHLIYYNCNAAIVHNGQISYDGEGCDTKFLLETYMTSGEREILRTIPGSYTVAIASKKDKRVIVMRDKGGMKPGALGWKDGKYVVASEDVAFKKSGAQFIQDLEPGCVYYLYPEGNFLKDNVIKSKRNFCFFEHNYISHVDSVLDGISVRKVRETLGERLAKEFELEADFLTFLPRCPEPAARKFAECRGIEFVNVFYKINDERSFQGSTIIDRQNSIHNNLFMLPRINGIKTSDALDSKEIIIIDDSTIRGNNSKRAIELLNQARVKKITLINYTPKIGIISNGVPRGCLYGVDMPPNDDFVVREKLENNRERNRTNEEINKEIGADVKFISLEGMLESYENLGISRKDLCYFCVGGKKPF